MRESQRSDTAERLWPCGARAIEGALKALDKSRCTEGRALVQALLESLGTLSSLASEIGPLGAENVKLHLERLRARTEEILRRAQVSGGMNKDAVEREMVAYADRVDVTEELARLRSHLDQFEAAIRNGGEVGKRLEFWCQEILREVNTVGSKALESRITCRVVEMKNLVEKLREQVQNLE